MIEMLVILGGIGLFLGGFYTGRWDARHNRETTVVEKPFEVVKYMPASTPAPQKSALVVNAPRTVDQAGVDTDASRRMVDLINQFPEG